uniref:NADH-ubiquinone oxidoreductase chain 2 n=1 Tax=Heterocerus parallelus TaxID=1587350 RepID=A0A343C1H7_9COLE|nr:NADH dehydrogenase subunit 2 [Heterocerus parallelus]
MNKMYKFLFLSTLTMSTMISVSSYSWMGMWMGLEINLLSFIPLMILKKNTMSTEAAIKYFLTQSMASTIIMFSILMMITKSSIQSNIENLNVFMILMNSAFLTKMGAAPFHFWFPEVMIGLDWVNSLILLTWQKIAPMVLLIYNQPSTMFMMIIIFSSMIIGSIVGMNQTSMRKIMAFSSINHIGWMIAACMSSSTIWIIYFMIYTLISTSIIYFFMSLKITHLSQLIQKMNTKPMKKFFFASNFLSLGGMPPFIGFMPKWITIQAMTIKSPTMVMIMALITLITLFIYMRMIFCSLTILSNSSSWTLPEKEKNNFWMLNINSMSILGLILMTIIFNWV